MVAVSAAGEKVSRARPRIGIVIGDPCGIGPEVVVKSWATGRLHAACRPVLIGSTEAIEQAKRFTGIGARVNRVRSPAEAHDAADVIDVIDSGALDPRDITLGRNSEACGRACATWLEEADRLARAEQVAATVMAPVSLPAMTLAGARDRVVSAVPGQSYLFLISGPLRVAHLTDHVPFRSIADLITAERVTAAIVTLDSNLRKWGLARPRIGVAGLNPHCMGDEDTGKIGPGVAAAARMDILAEGPLSPDTVFRQCVEGRYDAVLAMYHDQGHIPVKTWGFSGNSVVIIGPPYLHLSVAHGTAFDIVGKGVADCRMVLNAIRTAAYLSVGAGFPGEEAAVPA